jgi:hypothetical protein
MDYTKSVTGLGMWSAYRPVKRTADGRDTRELVEPEELAQKLLSLGVTWYAPRVGDTGKMFDFSPADFKALCAAFSAVGLHVIPWWYSRPAFFGRECELAETLLGLGASGVMIDAEAEWGDTLARRQWSTAKMGRAFPGSAQLAREFGEKLRARVGDAYVGHAPLAWMAYHRDWPYAEFGAFVDQVHPQSYWSELKHGKYDLDFEANCLDVWENLAASGNVAAKNVAPIGVTYGRIGQTQRGQKTPPPGVFTPAQLRKFLERYEQHDPRLGGQKRPHSLYSWEAREEGVEEELALRLERMRA